MHEPEPCSQCGAQMVLDRAIRYPCGPSKVIFKCQGAKEVHWLVKDGTGILTGPAPIRWAPRLPWSGRRDAP